MSFFKLFRLLASRKPAKKVVLSELIRGDEQD
jgi:hypothetical protein